MNRRERREQDKFKELVASHELYPEFVTWLQKESKKKTLTYRSLNSRLNILQSLRNNYGFVLEKVNIEDTMKQLNKSSVSAETVNYYTWVIRKWCSFRGIELDKKTFSWLERKTGPRAREIAAKDLLTADERATIISEIKSQSLKAFLAVLWDTGARPSEIAQMTLQDVEEDKHGFVLHVHQTKYKKRLRPVRMLDPHSIAIFGDWYIVHPNFNSDEKEVPVFLTNRHEMLDVQHVSNNLRMRFNPRFGRNTDQKASLNLYLYRKSRITHLLKEELLTPMQIKVRIGHTKQSRVLEKYYAILDEMDQAEIELKYLGVVKDEKQYARVIPCPQCGAPNLENTTRCFRCRQALSEKTVVADQEKLLEGAVRKILTDAESRQVIIDALGELISAEAASHQESEE